MIMLRYVKGYCMYCGDGYIVKRLSKRLFRISIFCVVIIYLLSNVELAIRIRSIIPSTCGRACGRVSFSNVRIRVLHSIC